MENNKKLDFNFDFFGEDKDPIEEQKSCEHKIITEIDEEKNDGNPKEKDNTGTIIIGICLVIGVGIVLAFFGNFQQQKLSISKIENETYSYYKICNGAAITSDAQTNYEQIMRQNFEKIAKIMKVNSTDIEEELYKKFGQKYNDEKAVAISKLASAYDYNKTEFNNLKEKYLPIYFRNNIDDLNQAVDGKRGYKELSLVPEPVPRAGLLMNYTRRQPMAPFKITTGSMHCYIKMYDAKTYELALTIFAPANQTTEVEVPLGNYIVKSARGYTWYGNNDLFGHNTICKQADTIMDFHIEGNYVVGKTLRLYETKSGNLRSETIDASEF